MKIKAPAAAFTNIGEWVVFTGLDAKSQLQITKADGASILINDAKMIKQKGKIAGTVQVAALADWAEAKKNKNVTLEEPAAPLSDVDYFWEGGGFWTD